MALTFSYKLVSALADADSADLSDVDSGSGNGKGRSKNSADFKSNSQKKGNKGGKKGSALDGSYAGILTDTASQSIDVYSQGTELDQARTYWLEVYASDDQVSDGSVTLESLDISLNFDTTLFNSLSDFTYADAFDLMRSTEQTGTTGAAVAASGVDDIGFRFAQGSAGNLKASSSSSAADASEADTTADNNAGGGNPNAGGGNPNAGGGNPNAGGGNSDADTSTNTDTSTSAESNTSGGAGIALSSAEAFVGRIELGVNHKAFEGLETEGENRTNLGAIDDYIQLTVNKDETILVEANTNSSDKGGKSKIKTAREYGLANEVTTGDNATDDDGLVTVATSGGPSIEYVTGQFDSDVNNAFDGFKTDLVTYYKTAGETTNLVREGQTLEGDFQISNKGQAGLTDIAMQWDLDQKYIEVSFDTATEVNTVSGDASVEHTITSGSLTDGIQTYSFTDGGVQLERGLRDEATGGVVATIESGDATDTLTVAYTAKVDAESAGQVAMVDFSNLEMTASGESNFKVFEGQAAQIKNVITYQGDLSYDGKVGMLDLAVLNEAKRLFDNGDGVTEDSDANHDGDAIDIEDLQILQRDWGESLWSGGTFAQADTAVANYMEASTDAEGNVDTLAETTAQNSGETAQTWDSTAFANASSLGTDVQNAFASSDVTMAVDSTGLAGYTDPA